MFDLPDRYFFTFQRGLLLNSDSQLFGLSNEHLSAVLNRVHSQQQYLWNRLHTQRLPTVASLVLLPQLDWRSPNRMSQHQLILQQRNLHSHQLRSSLLSDLLQQHLHIMSIFILPQRFLPVSILLRLPQLSDL